MMAIAVVCLVWAGMVLGISFLETPVKFTAPSVTLPIGLDIGRHVFGMFNRVEISAVLLLCGLLIFARAGRKIWLLFGALTAIVALQSVWLLPILDARVSLILSGQTPPPSPLHLIYVALEVLKLGGLLTVGTLCLRSLKGKFDVRSSSENSTDYHRRALDSQTATPSADF